jgi:Domain of unknown function (DUF4347)
VRLLVYDRGDRLTRFWKPGAALYRRLGRIDATLGVDSWDQAFAWLAQHDEIREIQYWGHGKWGSALVGDDVFDAASLQGKHAKALAAIRERLVPDALWWFRTCETFGANAGHDFAQRVAETLDARVAGHTFIIGFHQSGLHGLAPGMRPDWSPAEGLLEGSAADPQRARWSKPWAPRTITALNGVIPANWFVV